MDNTRFLPFLALVLLALGSSYGVGEGLLRMVGVRGLERYFRLFTALTLGLTVLVSAYALAMTHGLTILLPLLVLAVALPYSMRIAKAADESSQAGKQNKLPIEGTNGGAEQWTALLLTAAVALVLFSSRWLLLYDPESPFLLTPFQDYIYYGRVSEALNRTGFESRSLEQFYPQFLHRQPYHYYELWLNALLLGAVNFPAVWCLYLSAYTVLTTLVFTGLRALLAYFGWRGAWAATLALLMLLVSGIYWPAFENHPFAQGGRYVATSLLLLEPKLSPIYIFLLLSLLLLLYRQWRAVGLALAALPLVFVTTIPTVAGLTLGLAWALRGRLDRANLLGMLFPYFLALAYMAVFYLLLLPTAQPSVTLVSLLLNRLTVLARWRTMVNVLGGTLINLVLYAGAYSLLLLAGWGQLRESWRRWPFSLRALAGGLLLGAVFSALAFTLTAHIPDSYQLLGNTFPPLFAIAMGGALAAMLSGSGHTRRALVLAGMLALAWVNHQRLFAHNHSMHKVTRFDPAFLQQVGKALAAVGNKGGFFMADADYETIYHLTQDTFTRGTYVSNFGRDYAFASLSALDLPHFRTDPRFALDTAAAAACINTSSFARFVQLTAQQGQRWPKDSAQYQFVVQKGLRFLCLAPGVDLPHTLLPLVWNRYEDAVSGEVFIVLKPDSAEPIP